MSAVKNTSGFHDFGSHFQENFVKILLKDKKFCEQIREVFDVGFLDLSHLQFVTKKIFDYKDKYKEHPTLKAIQSVLATELKNENNALQEKIKEYAVNHLKNALSLEKIDDENYIKDKSLDFCKKQKLYDAMERSIELLNASSFDEISTIINKALSLGSDNNFGYDYIEDFDERFKYKDRNPITTGWPLIDNICRGGLGSGELGVVIAPTGCHAKGTEILMYDGTLKKVEDVAIGDKLMGPDNNPRRVLQLCRGREKMFEISPTRGKSFVVNASHVLSLKRTKDKYLAGNIVNISVRDYLDKSKWFKHTHKLYRVAVEFEEQTTEKEIPPYVLGCLLGDGCFTTELNFTSNDTESLMIREIKDYAG